MSYSRYLIYFFSILVTASVQAQLCTGSLGDPVVNINFSSATGTTAPGYTFTTNSCPGDGFYTVTPYSSNCFGNTWHTVTDHTGGSSFMLVNASFQPGDFFVQTVNQLCANTTYEFAAWIMNVLNRPGGGIQPNITFKIETPAGVVLKKYETGDIIGNSTPEWKQYGFYFTTPANNAGIVLRMTNNAPGGIGNDLALDDITFRPCGEEIEATIQGNTDTINVCEGNNDTYIFQGSVSSAYQDPAYQWQLSKDKGTTWNDIVGANSITYQRQPTTAGNYWYRLAVLEEKDLGVLACRIASNIVVVNIHSKPLVDAGPDRVMITGDSITLDGKAEGEIITYSWLPGSFMNDASLLSPTVKPVEDINYTLQAQSAFGCSNEDDVFVKVIAGIFIPNAFTPNGDGKNDTWKIPFLDASFDAGVTIFNRYGQIVFHSKNADFYWDGMLNGRPQPSGTYVYLFTLRGGLIRKTGTLTLIR